MHWRQQRMNKYTHNTFRYTPGNSLIRQRNTGGFFGLLGVGRTEQILGYTEGSQFSIQQLTQMRLT